MSDATNIEWCDTTWKECAKCKLHLEWTAFARDGSRPDGLTYWCCDCRNARARRNYKRVAHPKRPGPPRIPRRAGDKRQARSRVNHDVRFGFIADPNTLPCVDCNHRGHDRRHEYDHYLGYAAEHHGDVQAVCSRCHHAREARRRHG